MVQTIDAGAISVLREHLTGDVFAPSDADYDSARSIWNGAIDRKPAVVARCANAEDVARALRFGRERGLQIAVRGGGHNFAGFGTVEDGLMISLAAMNGVSVQPAERKAFVGGGATWGDVDGATQAHGLAVTGGFISHTGVAGLTLGGGMGWLTRKAGLSCDNLLSAEVVTVDGQILTASADENPDLFWALRGGGGNFGVVTRFEFGLHQVGPLVNLAFFFWTADQGAEALRLARQVVEGLPENTGSLIAALSAPPAPFVPEKYHFATGYGLLVAGFGSAEEHAKLMAPVREAVPPTFELVTPIPYAQLQKMLDESSPWGSFGYEKALYLDDLSDEVIAIACEQVPNKQSPMSFIPIFALGGEAAGAYGRVPEEATAFGGSRSARYLFNIAAQAPSRELYEADRGWVRTMWESLAPHSSNTGGYVNFMAENQEDRVRAAYGPAKYDRLAAIKAKYDPDNVLRLNANIRPATASS
jgi:FAD/FMN-containing dehydrogenase